MNIITIRDLSYSKVRNKLSKIAAKDQLKEEKNDNGDKVYAAELKDKSKKVKGKASTSTSSKPKKNASKAEYNYYKKYYPTIKWTDHT